MHRDGLRIALSGRDDVLLEPILRLLVKYVTDPRFGEMVCEISGVVIGTYRRSWADLKAEPIIEMYNPILGQSPLIDSLFIHLRKKVATEIRFQSTLIKTRGALDMIFCSVISQNER